MKRFALERPLGSENRLRACLHVTPFVSALLRGVPPGSGGGPEGDPGLAGERHAGEFSPSPCESHGSAIL